jgi:PRTRC genetic system protein C
VKEIQVTRKFMYNGITLPCPGAALSVDRVRTFYATQYPELNTATVEGPVTKNSESTYTFARAAGAKGLKATVAPVSVRGAVEALSSGCNVGAKGTVPVTVGLPALVVLGTNKLILFVSHDLQEVRIDVQNVPAEIKLNESIRSVDGAQDTSGILAFNLHRGNVVAYAQVLHGFAVIA